MQNIHIHYNLHNSFPLNKLTLHGLMNNTHATWYNESEQNVITGNIINIATDKTTQLVIAW